MAKGGEKYQEDIEKGVHIANYVLSCNNSSTSDNSLEVDLESGVLQIPVNNPTKAESGIPIELGCSCKRDLATAHKQCTETWFKIKGNKVCEICGLMTKNDVCVTETKVVVDQPNETANTISAPATINSGSLFWIYFKQGSYYWMLSNLFNYFFIGDGMYLYAFSLNLFFVIVCHCLDCSRKEENPSITSQPRQAD